MNWKCLVFIQISGRWVISCLTLLLSMECLLFSVWVFIHNINEWGYIYIFFNAKCELSTVYCIYVFLNVLELTSNENIDNTLTLWRVGSNSCSRIFPLVTQYITTGIPHCPDLTYAQRLILEPDVEINLNKYVSNVMLSAYLERDVEWENL